MSGFSGRRILLIIGGGIAAYKALDLIRRLRERGLAVRAVMTAAAHHFVSPLAVASLSGDRVFADLFSLTDEAAIGHIELSREADLVVVAPATADLLAKMAHGLADDLASTLLLATDKRILVAPAMNLRMWLAPATARNIAALRGDGVIFAGPANGDMACGEYGPGRMVEPLDIVAAIEAALAADTVLPLPADFRALEAAPSGALAGRRVVVTSGPTHEPIDPVRYIANRSSGKQGHAIAAAARAAGATVTLVSGPVTLADPPGVAAVHVVTAREMQKAVEAALPADIFVGAAAVADWRTAEAAPEKLKKGAEAAPTLTLVENPDILGAVGRRQQERPALVVGFAAETGKLIEHAQRKRLAKGCDLIVANNVGAGSGVFGGEMNEVTLISAAGVERWPPLAKSEVAARLVGAFARALAGKLKEPSA